MSEPHIHDDNYVHQLRPLFHAQDSLHANGGIRVDDIIFGSQVSDHEREHGRELILGQLFE